MSLRTLAPSKIRPRGIQHTHEQGRNTQGHRTRLWVFKHRHRPRGQESCDRTHDYNWHVNPTPPPSIECLRTLMAPRQAMCLLPRRRKILLQGRVPLNVPGKFCLGHLISPQRVLGAFDPLFNDHPPIWKHDFPKGGGAHFFFSVQTL